MARQARAIQAQPITLAALTARIRAAVQPQGWTAAVSREGDCLVVELTGSICPDPLLAMVAVEAELAEGSARAGLEAVKLYGAASADGEACGTSPSWTSVLDLGGYLARRAALPPQAFGLDIARASRLACGAERDRPPSPSRGQVLIEAKARPGAAKAVIQAPPALSEMGSGEAPAADSSLSSSFDSQGDPSVACDASVAGDASVTCETSVAPIQPGENQGEEGFSDVQPKPSARAFRDLVWEDPWELSLPQGRETHVPLSIEHFPRLTRTGPEQTGSALSLGPSQDEASSGGGISIAAGNTMVQTNRSRAAQAIAASEAAVASQMAAPRNTAVPGDTTVPRDIAISHSMDAPRSYETYLAFIADQSGWFAQTVKDNPRLHALAKQRQHHTLVALARYLVETLAADEHLVNLVPGRQWERSCGLILTDQRAIALSQENHTAPGLSLPRLFKPSQRKQANRQALQVWMVPWGWVHKVEISSDALCFHYGQARERFSVDLEAPYHLRNSIPRDIPVRIVQEIAPIQNKIMETKAGLAMVAGVMFALGSGFSMVNNLLQHQRLAQRPDPIALSRRSEQSSGSTPVGQTPPPSVVGSVTEEIPLTSNLGETALSQLSSAAPLEVTASYEQCINSFNAAAEPHAYATLNQVTQTFQVNLQNPSLGKIPPQQFDQIAASVANEILLSCQAEEITQVVITNGNHRYQQYRSDDDLS